MNEEIELRVPLGLGEQLQERVYSAGQHETVAFGLVGYYRVGRTHVLLLRQLLTLREVDYVAQHHAGAVWRGSAMLPAIEAAIDESLGIVLFHAHLHDGPPGFSSDDGETAERLIPLFSRRVKSRPHGSIVLSRTNAFGFISIPNRPRLLRSKILVRWFGSATLDWSADSAPPTPSLNGLTTQTDVTGTSGESALGKANVAVVGLGGGGSHVSAQLSHLGVGRLTLIDDDHVEQKHQHRIIGITPRDIRFVRLKTRVARRVSRNIGLGTALTLVEEKVPSPPALSALKSADVIVGCVDTLHSRRELQTIATRFAIPYVDIGLRIRALSPDSIADRRVSIGGNVITYIPGGFCMWCCGFISEAKLAAELDQFGYLQNAPGEAQVVSLNGVLASQAVNEVLQILTGFAGNSLSRQSLAAGEQADLQRGFKKLDGVRGTLEEWGGICYPDCPHCSGELARGEAAW